MYFDGSTLARFEDKKKDNSCTAAVCRNYHSLPDATFGQRHQRDSLCNIVIGNCLNYIYSTKVLV